MNLKFGILKMARLIYTSSNHLVGSCFEAVAYLACLFVCEGGRGGEVCDHCGTCFDVCG